MALKDLTPFARKWVKALKSGEYKRTSMKLTRHGRFCCLGVACAIQDGVPRIEWRSLASLEDEALPVAERLGLRTGDGAFQIGSYKDHPTANSLTSLNDDYKVSFADIAKFIATNPPGLFVRTK